jgi:hypothetical protein
VTEPGPFFVVERTCSSCAFRLTVRELDPSRLDEWFAGWEGSLCPVCQGRFAKS